MFKDVLKDRLLESCPPVVLNQVLPRIFPQRTPFHVGVLRTETIFVHVPKAAGSSLKTMLYGAAQGGHRSIAEFVAYDQRRTQAFFKIGFVRNPWDRLLSAYSFLSGTTGRSGRDKQFFAEHLAEFADFESFVASLAQRGARDAILRYDHFRPQAHWLCLPGDKGHAMDFLGRFETIEADTARLRDHLGLPQAETPQERKSRHVPYREAYSARSRQVVADLYARDIALFDYSF